MNNTGNDFEDFSRWTGDQQNINIYNTNSGNVSIGTTANDEPTLSTSYYKLTIGGRTNVVGASNAFNIWHPITAATGFRPYIVMGHENFQNGSSYGVIGINEYNSSTFSAKPLHLMLQTNPVDGGGNVGIGQMSSEPLSRLTIASGTNQNALSIINRNQEEVFRVTDEGMVYATKIKVQLTPFPDYVFSNDYELLTIDSVDAFIAENSHLPNVPNANNIEQNEIGLGELTRIQQEKIEELMLYIIELNRRVKVLESQD